MNFDWFVIGRGLLKVVILCGLFYIGCIDWVRIYMVNEIFDINEFFEFDLLG